MAYTTGIQQLKDPPEMGSDSNYSPKYLPVPGAKKHKTYNLFTGDILQGTILEVLSTNEVSVRLPSCTVIAWIHNRLKKGDTVFFKVTEIEPQLVLKIHAAPLKVLDKTINHADILRILDLPEIPFYLSLLEYYSKRKSIVYRENLLLIYKSFTSLGSEAKNKESGKIIHILSFMSETGVDFDTKIFLKLEPAFIGLKEMCALLKETDLAFRKARSNKHLATVNFLDRFFNRGINSNELLKVFSIHKSENTKEISFYNLLCDFIASFDLTNLDSEFEKTVSFAQKFIAIMESLNYYNSIASRSKLPQVILLPFFYKNELFIARLATRELSFLKSPKNNHNILLTIETGSEEEAFAKITLTSDFFETLIFAESEEAGRILEYLINDVKKIFINFGHEVKNISIKKVDNFSFEFFDEQSHTAPQRLSVSV